MRIPLLQLTLARSSSSTVITLSSLSTMRCYNNAHERSWTWTRRNSMLYHDLYILWSRLDIHAISRYWLVVEFVKEETQVFYSIHKLGCHRYLFYAVSLALILIVVDASCEWEQGCHCEQVKVCNVCVVVSFSARNYGLCYLSVTTGTQVLPLSPALDMLWYDSHAWNLGKYLDYFKLCWMIQLMAAVCRVIFIDKHMIIFRNIHAD